MNNKGILVVGGSGFIGKGIQEAAMDMGRGDMLTFAYRQHPENIQNGFKKVKVDLLEKDGAAPIKDYGTAIFVAGQGDQSEADTDPVHDLQMNDLLFLNFMRYFRGSLIMLSSQAVYQGLNGEIRESIDYVPESPFGISKRMAEAYADFYFCTGHIDKLWVFRLLYAYGRGEMERRLLPMCAWAASNKGRIVIHGGGRSYLNPLYSGFVGEVLLRATDTLGELPAGSRDIFNLNHPKKMTSLDVVKLLSGVRNFEFSIDLEGESWPIRYWGDTGKLANLLKAWGLSFPDARKNLVDYFLDIQTRPVKKVVHPKKPKREVVWPV